MRLVVPIVLLSLVSVPAQTQDGTAIAEDPTLFSERFRVEVIGGERPALSTLRAKHGDPQDEDDVELTLGFDDAARRVTLRFYYYGDIGFGVLPSDPEQLIAVVTRRPD